MIVKICGVTSPAVARAARESGADLLGLVFAPGRRQVSAEAARAISRVPGIGKVGVFVNAPLAEVREIARECRLDLVQLHGDEPPEYCAGVGLPVIKAFRAGAPPAAPDLARHPAAWILLDSCYGGQFGGTGVPFDWQGMQAARAGLGKPLLLAGGLNAGNVREAIRLLRPEGVDVSGGVETGGVKDPAKIAAFIRAVREGGD